MASRPPDHIQARAGKDAHIMEPKEGVSRRWALKAAGAAGATAILTGAGAGAAQADDPKGGDDRGRNHGVEPGAGTWKTWVLSSGTEIPVPPPPKGQVAKRDLEAVVKAAAARTDETLDAISFWDTGSPGFRWTRSARSCSSPTRHPTRSGSSPTSTSRSTTRRSPRGRGSSTTGGGVRAITG